MSTPFRGPGAGEIELKRAKRLEDLRAVLGFPHGKRYKCRITYPQ